MFSAFVGRMPTGSAPMAKSGARQVAVVVTPGRGSPLPWFALTVACLLRRAGQQVTLLWSDSCDTDDLASFARERDLTAAFLKHLPPFDVVRFSEQRLVVADLARLVSPLRFDGVIVPDGASGVVGLIVEAGRASGALICRFETGAGSVVVYRGDAVTTVATAFSAHPDDFAVWSKLTFDVLASDQGVQALLAAFLHDVPPNVNANANGTMTSLRPSTAVLSPARPVRIGVPIVGSKGWMGGVIYVQNLLRALKAGHAGQYQALLITDDISLAHIPEHEELLAEGLLAGLIHVGVAQIKGNPSFPITTVAAWDQLGDLVDVMYPGGWAPYFAPHVMCWIPDFQYHHLPQFSPADELAFRRQHDQRIASQARHVVFSSESARRDFQALFPQSGAITHLLHFHSSVAADVFEASAPVVVARYGCAPNYLMCSNQFWVHKNHRVLFAAMRLLDSRGFPIQLVCTGSPSDHRDRAYYGQLQAELADWNTGNQIRFLGVIPRADQVQLLRQARAVVQPSLFEGWSTVVEDARSLGVPLFMSDIAVHREQAPPNGWYFPPDDPGALAALIQEKLPNLPAPGRAREEAGRQHTAALVREFGDRAWSLLNGVCSDRPLIATSLAPFKLERQQAAVASWVAQGFDVTSINSVEEIGQLTPHFPDVTFRVATRDARALAGKPLVPLDDVLAALRGENRSLSAIVNSDIVLGPLHHRPLAEALIEIVGEGFAFNKRMDQEREDDPGVRYDGGIDAFFFGRKVLFDYPRTPYYLGLPWWDYFFAAYPLLAGHHTVEIKEPIAFHLIHKSFYDVIKHWIPLAIETHVLLAPWFERNRALMHSSGMDLAVEAVARQVTSDLPLDMNIAFERAYTMFARATIQLLRDGVAHHQGGFRPRARQTTRAGLPVVTGSRRLRVGLVTIGDANWMGGVARITHLLAALSLLPPDERPAVTLVVRPEHAAGFAHHAALFPQLDAVIQVGFSDPRWQHDRRLSVRAWDEVFEHVDFVFPAHDLVFPNKPAASWIADFQHERLAVMFTAADRLTRDQRNQAIASQSELLVLSSHVVRHDWERLFPDARPLVRIMPWRAVPQPAWYALDPAAVAAKHGINEPFLICSNQFSLHKGYASLVEAMGRLASQGKRPLVVSTGHTEDRRMAGFFQVIRARAERQGVSDRLLVLGLLPRDEQMALMRASLAVLQPSLFEGWNTVVEEARALGKAIILSDIDAHQEQAPPRAQFFHAGDAGHLAGVLGKVLPTLNPGPSPDDERQAMRQAEGLALELARDLCALAHEAMEITGANRQAPAA